jgi:hypothetical protein
MHQLKLRIVAPGSEVKYPLGYLLNLAIGAGIPDDDWYFSIVGCLSDVFLHLIANTS